MIEARTTNHTFLVIKRENSLLKLSPDQRSRECWKLHPWITRKGDSYVLFPTPEFKPDKVRLKTDPVSHPTRKEGLVNSYICAVPPINQHTSNNFYKKFFSTPKILGYYFKWNIMQSKLSGIYVRHRQSGALGLAPYQVEGRQNTQAAVPPGRCSTVDIQDMNRRNVLRMLSKTNRERSVKTLETGSRWWFIDQLRRKWSMKAVKHLTFEESNTPVKTSTPKAGLELNPWHFTAWTFLQHLY